MKRSIIIILIFITLIICSRELSGGTLAINKLLNIALKNNPNLNSLKSEYLSKEKEVRPASFPPDPVVSFSLMNVPVDTFSFDRTPMSSKQIAVQQMIPWPVKLALRGSIASMVADVQKDMYLTTKEKLLLEVRLKYYEIVKLTRKIGIEKEKLEQVTLFEKIAQTKYKVGKGLQQDILKAKVNKAQVEMKLIVLKTQNESMIDELTRLLGIESIDPLGLEFSYDKLSNPSYAEILNKARNSFPGVKLVKSQYERSKKELTLAKWNLFPDLVFGAAYSIRDNNLSDGGVDFYTLSFGLVVPLYFPFKQAPLIQAKSRMREASRLSVKDMDDHITTQVKVHYKLYKQSEEVIKLLEESILPEAKLSLDSSLQSYQVDKVDFLNVLQSLITLYNYYYEMEEAQVELYRHNAHLMYYAGGENEK